MKLPDTLPEQLYLLARRRGSDFALALRAAALTDLHQRGLLVDENGKARTAGTPPARLDPVLTGVLDRVAVSRPRGWRHWVQVRDGNIRRSVRDRLVEDGFLDLEERRFLGLIPYLRPELRDPGLRDALLAELGAALEAPLEKVTPRQSALAVLCAAGDIRSALTFRQRRAHAPRLRELTASTGPAAPALRAALRARRAARASA